MTPDFLPHEILVKIFEFLSVGDLLVANLVCQTWREAGAIVLEERVTVMATEDFSPGIEIFMDSIVHYKHWVFKEVEIAYEGVFQKFWNQKSPFLESLALHSVELSEEDFISLISTCDGLKALNLNGFGSLFMSNIPQNVDLSYRGWFEGMWERYMDHAKSLILTDVDMSERDLVAWLGNCCKVERLCLAGFSHILMTGTFLENEEDLNLLRKALRRVNSLRLSCSRYLTDLIFHRITSVVGPLRYLCLAGCQISYQNSIWKRFYPSDGSVTASDHVLTFKYILGFIEKRKSTMRSLNLGRTGLDSESLARLSEVPGLELDSLHLMACDQLTKSGIQLLTKNQTSLTDLDISLCSRVTDYAIIAIADNLPRMKALSIRRCQSVTEAGVETLSRLKHLEKLDISHLVVRKWESFHVALGTLKRPTMRWLNAASLPLQWETVKALADTMPSLRHLDLSMCVLGVNDKSIQAICESMVHLENLLLSGCSTLSDIGLSGHGLGSQSPSLPEIGGTQLSLETLGVRDRNPLRVPLGSKAEQEIRQEAEVRLYLQKNVYQIDVPSEHSLSHLQGLKQLNLCGCVRISDLTLSYAINFTELTYLNLSHCQQVNEEGLIQVWMKCPSLEEILLTDCSNTSDRVILVLAHKLKRIKSLDLQRCLLLTNDALDSLSSCRSLRYLDVSGCTRMTFEQVEEVRARIPRLLNFHHRGIRPSQGRGDLGQEEDPSWGIYKAPSPPPLLSKLVRKLTR